MGRVFSRCSPELFISLSAAVLACSRDPRASPPCSGLDRSAPPGPPCSGPQQPLAHRTGFSEGRAALYPADGHRLTGTTAMTEMAALPLLATASRSSSCFAAVTVCGIVPAPPDVVFPIFSDPTRAGLGVFSDVKSAKEVGRSKMKLNHQQHLTQEVEIEQVVHVRVLRLPVQAAMTVRLNCDYTTKQVRLRLIKGNMLVRRYEGVYVVLPHCGDPAYPPALPEGLAEALGPDAWRHLNAKLAADAAQEQQQQEQLAGAADSTLAAAARRRGGRRAQHSLVILHQRLQPALRPPPGLGGYVRGQVRRQFERMFSDLHRACQKVSAPHPAMQNISHWLRSFPLQDI